VPSNGGARLRPRLIGRENVSDYCWSAIVIVLESVTGVTQNAQQKKRWRPNGIRLSSRQQFRITYDLLGGEL